MKIHHLIHNDSTSYSQDSLAISDIQETESLNSSREDTPYFPISSNKYKNIKSSESEISSDQASSSYDFRNIADTSMSASRQMDKISPVTSLDNKETSSSPLSFEHPLSPIFNSPSPVPDLLLVNSDLWSQFYRVNNEMIITKADFVQVSKNRYRFKKGCWISTGPDKRRFLSNYSDGTVCGNPFTHKDSPQSGACWMNFGVSFPKIKLTNRLRPSSSNISVTNNNSSLPSGHFYLTSFHKYWPRIKMIKHLANEDQEYYFTFEETKFIAVTHYQNEEVNILKKNHNPHAKGFKESFKDQDQNDSYNSGSENSDNVIESDVDDDNIEVDVEEISDFGEKDNFSPSCRPITASNLLDQKVRRWRQSVGIETTIDDKSKVMRKPWKDDANQTNLYQGFRTKVVKNVNYTSEKQRECSSVTEQYGIGTCEANCQPTSEHNNENSSINQYTSVSRYEIDRTAAKRPKLDRPISFPVTVVQNKQEEPQFQRQRQQSAGNPILAQWNYYSDPTTPLSPGNAFFSTISNNKSSKARSLTLCVRLEQVENENKRLREFIRERYGVEAEREADAVVALGGKKV